MEDLINSLKRLRIYFIFIIFLWCISRVQYVFLISVEIEHMVQHVYVKSDNITVDQKDNLKKYLDLKFFTLKTFNPFVWTNEDFYDRDRKNVYLQLDAKYEKLNKVSDDPKIYENMLK